MESMLRSMEERGVQEMRRKGSAIAGKIIEDYRREQYYKQKAKREKCKDKECGDCKYQNVCINNDIKDRGSDKNEC